MTEVEKRKNQVIEAAKRMLHAGKNGEPYGGVPAGLKAMGDILRFTELLEEAERNENA